MTPLVSWFVVVGALLVAMALIQRWVARMPVSGAILYLGMGAAIGPLGLGMLDLDPVDDARLLEALSEVTVLVSVFAVGLKVGGPFRWARWRVPVKLATLSMVLTIALATPLVAAFTGLGLAMALLAASVLSPTDPVLASDVQIHSPGDADIVRFSLSVEGGLNDGTAFPFVMLALGFIGAHELGPGAIRWFYMDVAWATVAGLGVGWAVGRLVGRAILLRSEADEPEWPVEFLLLGLIALAYGLALAARGYGFLAVFAAGFGLRRLEARFEGRETSAEAARHQALAARMLTFSLRIERIAEVALVLVVGALLAWVQWSWRDFAVAAAVLLVVRPLAVAASFVGTDATRAQRRLVAWFGVRGIGSIYYLAFALHMAHETDMLSRADADQLVSLVMSTIVLSIVAHGLSATPLMNWYRRRVASGMGYPFRRRRSDVDN